MNIKVFIKELEEISPSTEMLESRGLPASVIQRYSKSLLLNPKPNQLEEENPLIEIVKNYFIDDFSIIDFIFLPEPQRVESYLIIGENEANSIAIASNGEVVEVLYTDIGEYELDQTWDITNVIPCACDSEGFLKAIKIAAELQSKRFSGEVKAKDWEVNKKYAERCIIVAGGEKYRQFWLSFLNCHEY